MLSRSGRPLSRALFGPLVRVLARAGVTPDALTWTGTVLTVLVALTLVPSGHLVAGALALTVVVLGDSLDGQLARATGTASPWGAFLDATLDRISDAAILGGLAWWALVHLEPGPAGLTAGLAIASLALALTVSYAKARAQAEGFDADVGLMERADRLVVLLLAMLLVGLGLTPAVLTLALAVVAAGSAVTVGQRLAAVRTQVRGSARRG